MQYSCDSMDTKHKYLVTLLLRDCGQTAYGPLDPVITFELRPEIVYVLQDAHSRINQDFLRLMAHSHFTRKYHDTSHETRLTLYRISVLAQSFLYFSVPFIGRRTALIRYHVAWINWQSGFDIGTFCITVAFKPAFHINDVMKLFTYFSMQSSYGRPNSNKIRIVNAGFVISVLDYKAYILRRVQTMTLKLTCW